MLRKWSWRLGRLAGIEINLHLTFVLLLAWIGLTSLAASGSIGYALSGTLFIVALFGCVLLHELGHCLMARRYGIRTEDITLLPIGGLARLERIPTQPRQELAVALAGPAVNVAIAGGLYLLLALFGLWVPLGALAFRPMPWLERLALVNLGLVLFNLLPAFPMDGGRVLRALLASRMTYLRATEIAAGVGRVMAVLFGLFGLLGHSTLLLIGLFVWFGGAAEVRMVRLRQAMRQWSPFWTGPKPPDRPIVVVNVVLPPDLDLRGDRR